jgi:hypothetical protein
MREFRLVASVFFVLLLGCSRHSIDNSPSTQTSQQPPSNDFFKNITSESGVRFVHQTPTNFFMPNQIGSGVTVFDFDQDGRLDLLFLQNTHDPNAKNSLYHQEPNGTFKDVSEGSGLAFSARCMGSVAGDVNNDGKPDLILTQYGATRLFLNQGAGHFTEATSDAGIDNPRWAVPASFIDVDRDGWLDIVVGNYVDYDPTQTCHDQQGRPEFCAPAAFPATPTRLWHNITSEKGGVPKFEDWTVRSGIVRFPGVALGLICADFTADNWPDIFCADDGRPNRLFVNQRNGTFTEEAARRGLAYNAMGQTAANMGVAYADFTGDGLSDLFVTHLTEEFHSLFRQDQPGLFLDVVGQSGLQQQGWRGTGFGTVAADFDSDGWTDLALVSGMIRRSVPGQTPLLPGILPWWGQYAQRPQIFSNNKGHFRDVSAENPVFCSQASIGRTLAVADLDNDGAPDLILVTLAGPVQIYRNTTSPRGHWVKFRLIDPAWGGRDAIGAVVKFNSSARTFSGVLQPAMSYLASNDPALHFGLGTIDKLERLQVIWPDGLEEFFTPGEVNRLVVLQKGSGEKASP